MSVKSSVSLGAAARSMDLLQKLGVKERDVQATIDNPVRRATVASAYKGDALAQIGFDDILAREANMLAVFQYDMDGTMESTQLIERALRQVEAARGAVSVHDRFIPCGLNLDNLFQFIYNWNAKQVEANQTPLKLHHQQGKEWWRIGEDVESIPTKDAIITCDFVSIMKPIDMNDCPFNLNAEEQVLWAEEQGGDGIMSAEEVVYLFCRSLIENRLPLWGYGSIRCRNTYGSGRSLYVRFDAGHGFSVGYCDHSERYGGLGAVAGKSLVLVS